MAGKKVKILDKVGYCSFSGEVKLVPISKDELDDSIECKNFDFKKEIKLMRK